MPQAWKAAAETMNAGMTQNAAALQTVRQHLHAATDAQHQFTRATATSGTALDRMVRSAETLRHSIFATARTLLRISGIGLGAVGGGLFGLDRLGNGISNQVLQARGLGASTAQVQAFQIAFGRFAPGNLLASLNTAQANPQITPLLAHLTGLSPNVVAAMRTTALARVILGAARRFGQANPIGSPGRFPQAPDMQALTALGFNQQGISELANLSPQTFTDAERQRVRILGDLGGSLGPARREFQRLHVAVDTVGRELERDLGQRLAVLAPTIDRLIGTFGKDAQILIGDVLSPANLRALDTDLQKFGDFLSSGRAQKSFEHFADSLENLSAEIATAGRIIGDVFHIPTAIGHAASGLRAAFAGAAGAGGSDVHKAAHFLAELAGIAPIPGVSTVAIPRNLAGLEAAADARFGFLPGTMAGLVQHESGGNVNAHNPRSTAFGLTQLTAGTQAREGVLNPGNAAQSIAGGARFLAQNMLLVKHLAPGLPATTITALGFAGYNQGDAWLRRFLLRERAAHRLRNGGWAADLPAGVQQYILGDAAMLGQPDAPDATAAAQFAQAEAANNAQRRAWGIPSAPAWMHADSHLAGTLAKIDHHLAKPPPVHITITTPTSARATVQSVMAE